MTEHRSFVLPLALSGLAGGALGVVLLWDRGLLIAVPAACLFGSLTCLAVALLLYCRDAWITARAAKGRGSDTPPIEWGSVHRRVER